MKKIKLLRLSIGMFVLSISQLIAQDATTYQLDFSTSLQSSQLFFDEDLSEVYVSASMLQSEVETQLWYKTFRNNSWSEWVVFARFNEGGVGDRTVWDGGMIGGFSAIIFKAEENIEKPITLRMYSGTTISKSEANILAGSANCSCVQPLVCNRSCWCPGGLCPPPTNPTFTTTNHIIVHHSAGANSSSNYAATVEGIWDFHVNTNGWDDIGYNWLIDPNGVIYTGRGDSVQGAHFSCMNGETVGICLLGNFGSFNPSDTALASLSQLIAWIGCKYNIAPQGSSWHAGSQMVLDNVAGHRHGNASTSPSSCAKGTVCPGDSLFAKLGVVADSAAALLCMGDVSVDETKIVNLNFYPNPVVKALSIELGNTVSQEIISIHVLNSNGQIVLSGPFKREENAILKINMEHLVSGLYFIKIQSSEEVKMLRVLKQ